MTIYLRLGLSALLFASVVGRNSASCQAPPTPKDGLTRLGISIDPTSLYAALHDPRAAVRSAAAAELAEMKDTGAITWIEGAMAQEQNTEVLFTFAQSLDTLGSAAGTIWLERYCSNAAEPVENRIRAAINLQHGGNYTCLPAMTEFLTSKDSAIQQSVLLYMLHIPTLQPNSPPTLGPNLLYLANGGATEYLRHLAGKVLMQIGDEATRSSYQLQHPKQN